VGNSVNRNRKHKDKNVVTSKKSPRSTSPASTTPQEQNPQTVRTPRRRGTAAASAAKTAAPADTQVAGVPTPKPAPAVKAASARAPRTRPANPPARSRRTAKHGTRATAVAPAAVEPGGNMPEAVPAPRVVTDEEIRVRAYFLSLEHRDSAGAVDFWLLAERELRPDTKTAK
jgi:hypothetical protein